MAQRIEITMEVAGKHNDSAYRRGQVMYCEAGDDMKMYTGRFLVVSRRYNRQHHYTRYRLIEEPDSTTRKDE